MSSWQKYPWIALVAARSNLAYWGDVASRFIFLGVVLYIFLRLWQVTYAQMGAAELGGFTLAQMLWYLVITESITLSGPRVAQAVDEDVRTGVLSVQLVRPMSYPLFRLSTTMGERLVRFVMNLLVGSVVALVFVGPIKLEGAGCLIFLLSVPAAFILDFLTNFSIGLGAFWLEDTSGLLLIYSRLTMILGGMLLPLELFPDWLQPVLKALPFSSVIYGPAHLLVHPDWSAWADLAIRQLSFILVLSLFVAFLYRTALKRVFSNGG